MFDNFCWCTSSKSCLLPGVEVYILTVCESLHAAWLSEVGVGGTECAVNWCCASTISVIKLTVSEREKAGHLWEGHDDVTVMLWFETLHRRLKTRQSIVSVTSSCRSRWSSLVKDFAVSLKEPIRIIWVLKSWPGKDVILFIPVRWLLWQNVKMTVGAPLCHIKSLLRTPDFNLLVRLKCIPCPCPHLCSLSSAAPIRRATLPFLT